VAAQLSSVEVRTDRSTESLAPDRNSFTVKDMPSTSGGTAVDVLRNVPAVEVDGDNNVSLRGNPNVVVQINGRVSPMRGQQLGNFLAQLPANIVAKVEVVSNPSAKNDPEGLGGIVNIVLKQQADLGTSGGLTAGGGSTGQVNANGNLGHQSGPWTLFGSYGFMHDRRTVSGFSSRADLATAGGPRRRPRRRHAPRVAQRHRDAEYKAGRRTSWPTTSSCNRRAMSRDFGSLYRRSTRRARSPAAPTSAPTSRRAAPTLDYALTWRHTPDQQKHTLVTELRANAGRDENDLFFSSAALRADGGGTGAPAALETNATRERSRALFAQTDWTRELRKGTKLETGYKGTFRRQTSDFDVATAQGTAAGAGAYAPDAGRSNAYAFDEHVHAAYGVLSQRAGRVDLQAGLRLETADTRFDLATTNRRYDNDYKSAFPSALASYTDPRGRQFKASYSKRISRPAVQQLNPFGFREDQFTVFEGNPGLRPEYTHAYELGFQQPLGKGRAAAARRGAARGRRHVGDAAAHAVLRHTVSAVRQIGASTSRDPPHELRERRDGRPVRRRREPERAARPVQRLRRRQRVRAGHRREQPGRAGGGARARVRLVGAGQRDRQGHAVARPAGLRDVPGADAHGAGADLALRARQRGAAPEAPRRQGVGGAAGDGPVRDDGLGGAVERRARGAADRPAVRRARHVPQLQLQLRPGAAPAAAAAGARVCTAAGGAPGAP
jgi:hypothetical protein